MKRYAVDTQCLLWYLTGDRRLPKAAKEIFDTAKDGRSQILIPSIALVQALFLLQRRRISEDIVRDLMSLPEASDAALCVVPLDMAIVRTMQDFGPAAVPELADRIITATARSLGLALLTVDQTIVESGLVEVIR